MTLFKKVNLFNGKLVGGRGNIARCQKQEQFQFLYLSHHQWVWKWKSQTMTFKPAAITDSTGKPLPHPPQPAPYFSFRDGTVISKGWLHASSRLCSTEKNTQNSSWLLLSQRGGQCRHLPQLNSRVSILRWQGNWMMFAGLEVKDILPKHLSQTIFWKFNI